MTAPGSVTHLLARLRSDDRQVRDEAAALLWNRYCTELVDLACQNLNQRLQRRLGPEDIVQQTFKSFFFRQQRGDFDLSDRNDLLRLLVRMTLNKTRGAAAKEARKRRDYRRDYEASGVGAVAEEDGWLLAHVESGGPTPQEARELAEEAARRLAQLPADLRTIALYKVEGYTNAEIAARRDINCSERSIERKLKLIREAWDNAD